MLYTSQMNISGEHGSKLFGPSNKNRRQSIIPASHLPRIYDPLPPLEEESQISSNDDLLLFEGDDHTSTNNPVITSNNLIRNDDDNIISQSIKSNLNLGQGESKEEFDFDSFILGNFTRYSGVQDINIWLDDTVKKFNRLVVSNYSRHKAIPLLVEGTANKIYVQNKRHIHSFADFQELLLLHFDNDDPIPVSRRRQASVIQPNPQLSRDKSMSETNSSSMTTFNNSHFSERPPKHHSTTLHENKMVNLANEPSNSSNPMNPTPFITLNKTSDADDTTNVLRKALIHQLMNNPKIFRGGNEDVVKWLEDLEHSYEVAHIPDNNKLDLVTYALRGEALVWYKNHKSNFSTWCKFVSQLKHTYVPVYYQELAFKKLDAYSQTENQSICNFYNHLIKLCNDADPTMTDSTKLKHLLNKTKPSLQFEIRRKKPTTSEQFLEDGKDVEELFHLSTFNTNINLYNNNRNTTFTPTAIISPPMVPSTFNHPNESFTSTTRSPKTNNYNPVNSPQHHNNNTHRSSLYIHHPTNSSTNGPRIPQAQSNSLSNPIRPKASPNPNHSQDARVNNSQRSRTFPRTNTSQHHNINSLMHSNYTNPSAPEQQPLSHDYGPQHQPNPPSFQTNRNF